MSSRNQKLISYFILTSIVTTIFFSTPKKTNAFWGVFDTNAIDSAVLGIQGKTAVTTGSSAISNKIGTGSTITNTSYTIKQWAQLIYEQTLMAIAKRVIQQITKSTINWINGGFHGSPLFLENPQSFFKDIAKYEVKNLIDTFGYDLRRFPFGKDFALNTIRSYKNTLEINAASSLNNVMSQQEQLRYYSLDGGGWNGFFLKTQYPQNNYLGFQQIANQELASKLQGTIQNAAQKITTTLNQGQGFLSPQNCPSNPDYNNGTNEFQKPNFDQATFDKNNPIPDAPECVYDGSCTNGEDVTYEKARNEYLKKLEGEKAKWQLKNTCPGGLVNTTPGSVVANQITTAMGSQFRQTELGAAMGNSLSAIFDALLNKFIGDGLNSLASKKNSTPPADAWTYNGISLGSPTSGNGSTWDSGPEEEIILDKFKKQINGYFIGTCNIKDSEGNTSEEKNIPQTDCKKSQGTWTKNKTGEDYIPGDIANTKEEIRLMDNPACDPQDIENCKTDNIQNPINPNYTEGLVQLINPIISYTKTLDQCLPGPDKGWEDRLIEEQEIASSRLSFDIGNSDQMKQRQSALVLKELKFAIDSFKNWIDTKMIGSLPNAIIYMDALKKLNDFPQQIQELKDTKRSKAQTLARLQAIADNLEAFGDEQPKPGSTEEKQLIAIKKQYNAIRSSIASVTSIEDKRNELNILKDQLNNLNNLNQKCNTERKTAGWEDIDGTGKGGAKLNGISEKDKFCSTPIQAGYSHGDLLRGYDWHGDPAGAAANATGFSFRNPRNSKGDAGYEDIPLVNAHWVYGDVLCTGICSWPDPFSGITGFSLSDVFKTADDRRTDVNLNCDVIFKANTVDYTHAGDISF